ncbi:SDR family oxidoreductase [Alloacidobacterium sp.]|uniref:SDR family oxidoreductase n=1 Tax=Alloacidobacterium sp. TaxID=2951999 RepID=UPI002D741474|nr:SDR family oxidoreductase [Alloacidobacterium sp.]HYK34584.1 SDR family oxidoreductase [Alloacidobacterium sp.]
MELAGQLAVVTGAGRGIGEAISKRLASMGAFVMLVARDMERLERVQREIQSSGGSAQAAQLDLLNEQSIAKFAENLCAHHGRCDILVNNAAIGSTGTPLHEMPPAEWDRLMATNLRGPYLMIRALTPMMIAAKSGHIINISSLAGHNPLPRGAAYSASKWGLNGLTYSVAEELRPHNIRVSVIAPGSTNTRFEGQGDRKDPNKKIQPDDVGRIVAMLVTQAPQSFISEVLIRPTQKP